jgi:hypothetical protein
MAAMELLRTLIERGDRREKTAAILVMLFGEAEELCSTTSAGGISSDCD